MKRVGLVLLLSIVAAVAAQAQAPAAPAAPVVTKPAVPGTKVVIVSFERALLESAPGKAFIAQYEKETAPEIAKMEKLAKEIGELQPKLQAAKTDAERNTITRDIEAKQREGERVEQDTQRIAESLRQTLVPPVFAMVKKAVADWAAANGVAAVLDPSTEPGNIVFADPANDITNEVMRAVNAAYEKDPKLAAPAAAPK